MAITPSLQSDTEAFELTTAKRGLPIATSQSAAAIPNTTITQRDARCGALAKARRPFVRGNPHPTEHMLLCAGCDWNRLKEERLYLPKAGF